MRVRVRSGVGRWLGAPQHSLPLSACLPACLPAHLPSWLSLCAVLQDVPMMRTRSVLSLQVDGPVLVGTLFLSA